MSPERVAYICNHKDHGDNPIRVFLSPGDKAPPQCDAGHKMIRQPNRKYKGTK